MGVSGSTEMKGISKSNGEVDSGRVADIATDLVILDKELDKIKSLLQHARNENIPIALSHVLQVRSYPTLLIDEGKTLAQYGHSHKATSLLAPDQVESPPVLPIGVLFITIQNPF